MSAHIVGVAVVRGLPTTITFSLNVLVAVIVQLLPPVVTVTLTIWPFVKAGAKPEVKVDVVDNGCTTLPSIRHS